MLSPRAVRAFRDRPRRDYSLTKKLTVEELNERMKRLPVRPPIWNKLKRLQKNCLVIGARRRRFAFFNDTGTGKTYLSIALMRYFEKLELAKRNLILVPNKVNKWEWAEEGFDKHAPNIPYVVLQGSSTQKWKQIEDNPDAVAFIETYAGYVRMLCELKEVKRKGKKAKNKLVPDRKRLAFMAKFFDGVYCDESTYLANKKALPYRCINKLSDTAEVFFILTATPFGRDVTMAWAQMFLVDRGDSLGETLTLFREAFFNKTPGYWGGFNYTLKKEGRREISKFLDHGSITYPADEADLPYLNRIPKYASLGESAEAYYSRAKQELISAHGNFQEMKNAFLRMRQISSGFIGYKDDETGEKAKFVFPTNPKLDLVEAIVQKIPERYKFILFHEFNYSAHVLSDLLKDMNIKHGLINGMTKDTASAKTQFKNPNSDMRGMIMSSAGAYGLNFQIARYGIFYESPVPVILRKQTEKRFDRQYSPHKNVFLYDCIVRGTADESILDFHKEGRNLWKAILSGGAKSTYDR